MSDDGVFVRKNITIREDQAEKLEDSAINLSKFVQNKLDEVLEEE